MRTWHITWGTHGERLHGGDRATVDVEHNERGEGFIFEDPARYTYERNLMEGDPVYLTLEQQSHVQAVIPELCERGGWILRTCSAGADHVHVLLDVDRAVHGEEVRRILKRWITQALEERWPKPDCGTWWARQGSNRPVTNHAYLNNAYGYVCKQRAK
jgi:REP element-mobilizing transposase RayT